MNKFTEDEYMIEDVSTGDAELIYLPVDEIYPHKDNPRKELGDLTELAESIKAQGILQNLTVVRGHFMTDEEWKALAAQYTAGADEDIRKRMNSKWSEDGYTVIIGHRRLAASKLAGLTDVPCVVTEMTRQEQLSTMMCENMQRNDLTIYEQAKGFEQLRMEGLDVAEISKRSGFSDTTVRSRLKLATLNGDLFKDACNRGGTLDDYAKVNELELDADRDKLLKTIGTEDFKNTYSQLIRTQKWRHRKAEWLELLATYAEKVDDVNYGEYRWNSDISEYNNTAPQKPDDADTKSYVYTVAPNGSIHIYVEREEEPEHVETEEERLRRERREKEEALEAKLEDINKRHFELRKDFVKNFAFVKKNEKEHRTLIRKMIVEAIAWYQTREEEGYSYSRDIIDMHLFCEVAGVEWEDRFKDNDYAFRSTCFNLAGENAEKIMLCMIFAMLDKETNGYWKRGWINGQWTYDYYDNSRLEFLYADLKQLGYEMSTEEKQMRDNECPLLHEEEDA